MCLWAGWKVPQDTCSRELAHRFLLVCHNSIPLEPARNKISDELLLKIWRIWLFTEVPRDSGSLAGRWMQCFTKVTCLMSLFPAGWKREPHLLITVKGGWNHTFFSPTWKQSGNSDLRNSWPLLIGPGSPDWGLFGEACEDQCSGDTAALKRFLRALQGDWCDSNDNLWKVQSPPLAGLPCGLWKDQYPACSLKQTENRRQETHCGWQDTSWCFSSTPLCLHAIQCTGRWSVFRPLDIFIEITQKISFSTDVL